MYYRKREQLFHSYNKARDHFTAHPDQLIKLEKYCTELVNNIIQDNYSEIEADYNEATYLNAFWAKYPPDDRGRQPVGDQIPWIEVGEHAIGHKLSRIIGSSYRVSEIGLPSGADNRFVLYSDEISDITDGFTNCALFFLDIKSVGPRDNFDHTVISPYQVSGDGIWNNPNEDMENTTMYAQGKIAAHEFYPAISPIYPLTRGDTAPTIHLFVKPVYRMLSLASDGLRGQPLESIKNICVPNGLLLSENPGYLNKYPGLFFPGKDDKAKAPRKIRVRVSFKILREIAPWRVTEFPRTDKNL
ncbi:MAG: BglI family type II restriction endonuclease [bacterium]|nr:BglI family type II restriction endonuclease [bacterium]MCM1375007.1 BglI family type II restriction endonuclease [Muribaculum sp.]